MITIRNILVPVDFSECSRVALEKAYAYADQFGAALHVLHVHADGGFGTNIDDARQRFDQFIGDTSEHCFPVVRTFKTGSPTSAICTEAADIQADIIIMGTHGAQITEQRILGSVAEHVVRKALCDVLTVHEREVRSPQTQPHLELATFV
jgi:nucleotide-binding universal stress UspA family protein